MASRLILALCMVALTACGSNDNQENSDTADDSNDKIQTSQGGVYGVWEGDGAEEDGYSTFKMTFTFKPGRVTLVKKCVFDGGTVSGNASVTAYSTTLDKDNGNHVTLTSALYALLEAGGMKCSINLPSGLELFLRDGKMVLRRPGEAEKVTSLKKIS